MVLFSQGALAMACWVAGLFFMRFWRSTADRLFFWFALAFWMLTLHWSVLAWLDTDSETRYFLYLPRLLAFLLIITAIIDKNRRTSSR
jgi:hypothetical protein